MINETNNTDTSQATEEISEIELNKVEFQRSWVFWENYQQKEGGNSSWEDSIKKVVQFSDLITFWQFWNNYPGAVPKNFVFDGERLVYYFENKKRIDGLNLFVEGVVPKWEDPKNSGGRILHLLYDIKQDLHEFLFYMEESWLKLVLLLIGESMPASKYVSKVKLIIIICKLP
jgi:hypothetical protein